MGHQAVLAAASRQRSSHDDLRERARRAAASIIVGSLLALLVTLACSAAPAEARSPARCASQDRTEPALQGQVPVSARQDGSAVEGYWCNLQLVGARPDTAFANFETYKNCAYYSNNKSASVIPGIDGSAGGVGVVLDVSDPSNPVQTDTLRARSMQNAGESLRVNAKRGLLVADYYSLEQNTFLIPLHRSFAVYSIKDDCRKPKLLADVILPTQAGHEGCFAPDGNTYYMANGITAITPIDLRDPTNPREMVAPWSLGIHGCSISDDGNRGYFAGGFSATTYVVDTSAAQAGRKNPGFRVLGTFGTPDVQIQQATYPLSYKGRPYLLQWSEGKLRPKVCIPGEANFGYARLIDMSDETRPQEVSKIQTEVMRPENCAAVQFDLNAPADGGGQGSVFPSVLSAVFLYDTHMCTPDRLHDPTILACANFGSGLRVFDIRDPTKPNEIAYYNTGTVAPGDPTLDLAIARPVIRSDLGQIWFVTNSGGFHAVQFREGVWPFKDQDRCPSGDDYFLAQYDLNFEDCRKGLSARPAARCQDRRVVRIPIAAKLRKRVKRIVVVGNGRRIKTLQGPRRSVRLDLRRAPAGKHVVRLRITLRGGRVVTVKRTYRLCAKPVVSAASSSPTLRSATNEVMLLCRLNTTS